MNKLLTPDEAAKSFVKILNKSGWNELWEKSTKEQRIIMTKILMNMFGARFPI